MPHPCCMGLHTWVLYPAQQLPAGSLCPHLLTSLSSGRRCYTGERGQVPPDPSRTQAKGVGRSRAKGPSQAILVCPGPEGFVLQPSLGSGFPLWPSPLGLRVRPEQKSDTGTVALCPPQGSYPSVTKSASFPPQPHPQILLRKKCMSD